MQIIKKKGGNMTFHYRYRKQIILILSLVLIITVSISSVIYFYKPNKEKKVKDLKVEKIKKEKKVEQEPTLYMVDIKGQVINPGIYELSSSSRIIDVITKAGGLTEIADTSVINLSKKIEDEMVIIIYSEYEVTNWIETKEQEKYLQEKCRQEEEGKIENDACITEDATIESTTININTATKEELMTLTGIGEAKADAIISYREQTAFTKIEDLKNVSGIGDSIYNEIKDRITV